MSSVASAKTADLFTSTKRKRVAGQRVKNHSFAIRAGNVVADVLTRKRVNLTNRAHRKPIHPVLTVSASALPINSSAFALTTGRLVLAQRAQFQTETKCL